MYTSALILCPSSSWLHKYHTPGVKVVKGSTEWGACIRTVSCSGWAYDLACWSNIIAAGFTSSNIIIFDAITGSQTSVISEHTEDVQSLAFSLDGTLLVSGSRDKTVKLWDIQTSRTIKTFYGHTDWVKSVSISTDNTMIASGDGGGTVHLWNIKTGNCSLTSRHEPSIDIITFSPKDSQLFLSSSVNTVQLWGTDGHQIGKPISGSHATFSPDGTQFVSCHGATVTIRNTDSGASVVGFYLPHSANCCYFSPNGRLIAAAAWHTIYLWDIAGQTPCLIQTLTGHTDQITSIVFSSSLTLASTSRDKSIKFWHISPLPVYPGAPSTEFLSPASISSVSLQAKDDLAFTVDSEGTVKTWNILTGSCMKISKTPANNISYADIQSIDGRLIIAFNRGKEIYIGDVMQSEFPGNPIGYEVTRGLRITGDGSRVLGVKHDSIQVWDINTRELVGTPLTLENQKHQFDPFRMDGSKVLVRVKESVQGLDFGVLGSNPTHFPVSSPDKPHLNFIDLSMWSKDSPVRIEDSVTGKEVFQLCGRYAKPSTTQWDGQYLIAGYKSGEILILDFSHVLPK